MQNEFCTTVFCVCRNGSFCQCYDGFCQLFCGDPGFLVAVSGGTHFDQQRAFRQVLIEPLGPQLQWAHDPRGLLFQLYVEL